jgi:hypothetical protein
MRRKSVLVLCLALVGVLALVAAGCGGGGKKSAATTTEAVTTEAATTEATTTEATTTEAVTTEAATTEATTTSNLSGISGKCKEFADLGQKFSAAFSGSANGGDVKKQAALFQQLADKAPSDIRADFQLIAKYFSKVAEVAGGLKAGTTPDAATIAKLQKLQTEVDQTKLTQAGQHISAWAQKNCKA